MAVDLLRELRRGVVAHLFLAVVHGGDLQNDGEVAAGADGDRNGRDLHAQQVHILLLKAETVEDLLIADRNDVHDEVHGGFVLDGSHAEQLCHVDDADTADLDIVADQLRRRAAQRVPGDLANFHGVICDQAVAALEQLGCGLAFADAAFAHEQQAFSVDLDEHTVARDARGQRVLEVGDEAGDDIGRGFQTAQNGDIVLFCHLHALGHRLNVTREDECGDVIGEELVEGLGAALRCERVKIGRLGVTDDLQAQRLKMRKKACQGQTGTHDLFHHEINAIVIAGFTGNDEVKFLHDLLQPNAVGIHGHDCDPPAPGVQARR